VISDSLERCVVTTFVVQHHVRLVERRLILRLP